MFQNNQTSQQHAVEPLLSSIGDKSSRWRRLNNGLPQGSVLAPILFNLYMSDIPITVSEQFQYADDIALTFQANSFAECETTLEADHDKLDEFFRRWRLQPNPSKTESCVIHLNTHEANTQRRCLLNGGILCTSLVEQRPHQ
jgi:hypothetical protein